MKNSYIGRTWIMNIQNISPYFIFDLESLIWMKLSIKLLTYTAFVPSFLYLQKKIKKGVPNSMILSVSYILTRATAFRAFSANKLISTLAVFTPVLTGGIIIRVWNSLPYAAEVSHGKILFYYFWPKSLSMANSKS